MAITIKKGLIGKEDVRWYTAASPTFTRDTSTGSTQTMTAVAATHIPLIQGAASLYFSANNVQRAITETLSRYVSKDHSMATYSAGARVGDHRTVFGIRNATAATSIQAAASNQYKTDGVARIFIPSGTYTMATPISLPRVCYVYGSGPGTVIRASSTIQTSRVFSIAGTTGATTSNLTANGTINTGLVFVANGALFSAGQYIKVEDSQNSELQQVLSVAGNTLTCGGRLRSTYRSAATVKKATIAYPAEVWMDNLTISLSSATQGFGVAATNVIRSYFGPGVTIKGAARAGMYLQGNSERNRFEGSVEKPSATSSGKGFGVWLTGKACYDNRLSGQRDGTTKDVSEGGKGNFLWGVDFRGAAVASGPADPMSYWYRMRKPELSYASYTVSGTATTVVSCPAGTNNPAEVYIDGHVYRNTGTILCDLSRTKLPTSATVGGLDRGPAAATTPYYIYAVPCMNPSATRQFDLVASSASPANGPLASATFPSWSWLGAVTTGSTVRLQHFRQSGDRYEFNTARRLRQEASPAAKAATVTTIHNKDFPASAKAVKLGVLVAQSAFVALEPYTVYFTRGDETNANNVIDLQVSVSGHRDATGKVASSGIGWVGLDANRKIGYSNDFTAAGGATVQLVVDYKGYLLDRGSYK